MMFNKNRTFDPLEGRGGYSTVYIPAGPIAPIGTQWHVFYLPLSLNTISLCVKKLRQADTPSPLCCNPPEHLVLIKF